MSSRIVVVDDFPVTRAGTMTILARDASLEVVGEAADGAEALALCRAVQPDLVVLDVRLPTVSGLTVARTLRPLPRPPRILMLSAFPDPAAVHAALAAGATGYVLKSVAGADLLRAVQQVLQGEQVLLGVEAGPEGGRAPLSPQEVVILGYVAEGLATKEIARRLAPLSIRTVESYLTRIYRKLGVCSRAEALAVARRAGLFTAQ